MTSTDASSVPVRAQKGMVASQNAIASRIGADVIEEGGSAVDAVVATAFALAVTHPTAGNIGGGGFIVFRPVSGEPVTYDFRERAPAKASPTMWGGSQGVAQVVIYDPKSDVLEGGSDRRAADGAPVGVSGRAPVGTASPAGAKRN